MKILWILHGAYEADGWEGSRQFHLFKRLKERHDLHMISWVESRAPKDVFSWGKWVEKETPFGICHTITLGPKLYSLLKPSYPKNYHIFYNQIPFRRAITQIFQSVKPDVIVMNASHHITGFPKFDFDVPIVYDHLDESPDWVEKEYANAADEIITVSQSLANAVVHYNKTTTIIKNGVDLERYKSITKSEAKEKLGLENKTVISLIGLTCAPSLYFIDAIKKVQESIPNVFLITVGGGRTHDAIIKKIQDVGIEKNAKAIGFVPNSDVHWYFAATDIGLYPGENNRYYQRALPLKVVEYSACNVPVVSSPVDAFVGWPNVYLVQDNADAFADAIQKIVIELVQAQDVSDFDWNKLTHDFEKVLSRTLENFKK